MIKTIFILYVFGILLLPSGVFACGMSMKRNNSEILSKSCCKKVITSKTNKNECCSNKQSKDKDNSCGGKCGHPNCTTSTVNFSLISFYEIEFKNTFFAFSSENQKFYYSKTFISSGFNSVWLPPKIN